MNSAVHNPHLAATHEMQEG